MLLQTAPVMHRHDRNKRLREPQYDRQQTGSRPQPESWLSPSAELGTADRYGRCLRASTGLYGQQDQGQLQCCISARSTCSPAASSECIVCSMQPCSADQQSAGMP